MINKDRIRLALQIALLGEIYPAIRAIAFAYNSAKLLKVRFYLDREPNEDDYESVSSVMSELIASFNNIEISEVIEECFYSTTSISELDSLDGLVYSRREY